jgi:hypothetical protein
MCELALDINEVVKYLITVIALYIGYRLGLRAYFRQKDYELVRQRYLIDGVDEVAANIEYGLSVYRNNWARGLQIIRMFRDVGDQINPKMLEGGFIDFDQSKFQMRPHHRMEHLVGDMIFWRVQQNLAAFVIASTGHIKEDMCTEIKLNLSCPPEKRKEIVDKYDKLLLGKEEESWAYYVPLEKIQDISRLLERTRFTPEEIEQLKNKEFVKEAVQVVKQKFSFAERLEDTTKRDSGRK